MTNSIVNIRGKQYMTVAGRVEEAHKANKILSITTEIVSSDPVVVFKATVTTSKGTFTGHSGANPNKMIEKESPFEVAETSAVGRALGFARYGIVEGIATADEVKVATRQAPATRAEVEAIDHICQFPKCNQVIDQVVVQYCLNNKQYFGGKVYCFEHQKAFKMKAGVNAYKGGAVS